MTYSGDVWGLGMDPSIDKELGLAAEAEAVRLAQEATRDRDVVTTTLVEEGHPARILVETVTPADLLVVGSRGHGGFVGALIGSVSQHVVTHADCPVVVVPCRARATRP
jgi:nucleotide-binding universal stress UspA family protein